MIDPSTKIAILWGGASAEAQVSRSSAGCVHDALADVPCQARLLEVAPGFVQTLIDEAPDVVFPVLHGPPGEDGTVQGLLEMLDIPYVGSDVRGCALAMDKRVAKCLFRDADLPVAEDAVIERDANPEATAAYIEMFFGDRVVVKPVRQGSAIGITPLPNGGNLVAPLAEALALGDGVLVERYVMGREITVGVLDLEGEPILALPATEIVVADGEWYDYENRYTVGKSEHITPAPLDDEVAERVREIAVRAHEVLELRDLSRVDFIVGEEEIALLEVNAIPGLTPTSLYPDGCRAVDISFEELVQRLIASALRRKHAAP